jgi:hypothetical protein
MYLKTLTRWKMARLTTEIRRDTSRIKPTALHYISLVEKNKWGDYGEAVRS